MKENLEDKTEFTMDCSSCVFMVEYHTENGLSYYCYNRKDIDINNPIKCENYEFNGFP